jgi:hypothetical protein
VSQDEEGFEGGDYQRDRDGLSILAWALMNSHYHLVIKTGSVPLWRSMARLQGKVARGTTGGEGTSAGYGRAGTRRESSIQTSTSGRWWPTFT